jgi:hypothetical protein
MFKLRITNFTATSYKVEYSNNGGLIYYTIQGLPIWTQINKNEPWRGYEDTNLREEFFLSLEEAKNFAQGFKSIDDIKNYHEKLKDKLNKYILHRKEIAESKKVNIQII